MGLLEALLQLQAQVVDADAGAGGCGHAALGRLRRARGGGAVQDEAHQDDGEGQDVEPRKLGGEKSG